MNKGDSLGRSRRRLAAGELLGLRGTNVSYPIPGLPLTF